MHNKIKIGALDVDGVLNRNGASRNPLEEDKVQLLKQIVDKTGCKFLICSTWRKYEESRVMLEEMCKRIGSEIVDYTPVLESKQGLLWKSEPRWTEIKQWLSENPEYDLRFILDDDWGPYSYSGLPHLIIPVDGTKGLTQEIVEKVVDRFNN